MLILDAAKIFKKGRNQNILLPEHIEQIFGWYREYKDAVGIGRVVTLEEISNNDWNLNISRYIEPAIKEETSNVAEALVDLKQSLEAAYAAEDRLKKLLQEAGLMSDG